MTCLYNAVGVSGACQWQGNRDFICDLSVEKWLKFVETKFVTGEYESFKITNVAQPS